MHSLFIALVAFMAFTATSHPFREAKHTHLLPSSPTTLNTNPHTPTSTSPATNTTLTARAENGICNDLELPTEATYRTGYESFCKNWVPAGTSIVMGPRSAPLVVTSMLRTHVGTTIPWVFKIRSQAWGYTPYYLRQERCLSGFRDMLEGREARLGRNFCVVGGTGGDGGGKGLAGQGHVLVMEQVMQWPDGDVNDLAAFEARKRKGG